MLVMENHRDDDKTQTHISLLKDIMVGHYRIVEKIGAGGMGEVYLAADTQLDRKVALKFLPPHLCQDEECRARFKREAQAAAKLSHPNIIHVYDVSEYKGRPFFAMEHVEGRSLKELSSGKDFSIEHILDIAIQICEGLQAAHDKGVIHRDIKPSNILVDSHGRVKIVDFGLASVAGQDHLTKTGSTLGTIGYMSPEQVLGQEIDHRSDLFSLGVVLYELITKRSPFKRDSEAATLKAVSDDQPEPLARFKSGLPDGMQAVIDKALDKNRDTRYQHADDLRADLLRIRHERYGQVIPGMRVQKRSWTPAYAVTALILVTAGVIAAIMLFRSDERRTVAPEFKKITYTGDAYYAVISPDGKSYACTRMDGDSGSLNVYVGDFEGGGAIPVFHGSYVQSIRWSPDGRKVLLRGLTKDDSALPAVYLVPRFGGTKRKYSIPGTPPYYWDIAWLPDGKGFVTVADGNRLIYVDIESGDTAAVALAKTFDYAGIGNFSPDGEWLLLYGTSTHERGLWVVQKDGSTFRKLLGNSVGWPRWSPAGDAVYIMSGSLTPNSTILWRLNIDRRSGELSGEPEMLLSGLPATIGVSVSDDGKKLLCRQFNSICNLWRVFFRSGDDPRSLRREQLTLGTGQALSPSISPDGRYFAYSAEVGGEYQIYVAAVDGGERTRLSRSGVYNLTSAWSPDGSRIAFMGMKDFESNDATLIISDRNGETAKELLTVRVTGSDFWLDWAMDTCIVVDHPGRSNLLLVNPETGDTNIWRYDMAEGGIHYPRLSPDGKLLAACRNRAGVNAADIWTFSLLDGGKTRLAELTAYILGWSRDHTEVYFCTEDRVIGRIGVASRTIDTLAILPDMEWFMRGTSIALSPDKKWAIYEVGQVQRDIYLIEDFDPHVK